jgi:hypothetical protein
MRLLRSPAPSPTRRCWATLVQTYLSVEQRWPHRPLTPYLDHAEHAFTVAPHFAGGAYEDALNLFWPVRPRGAFYGPYTHSAKAPRPWSSPAHTTRPRRTRGASAWSATSATPGC